MMGPTDSASTTTSSSFVRASTAKVEAINFTGEAFSDKYTVL